MAMNEAKILSVVCEKHCPNLAGTESNENIVQ